MAESANNGTQSEKGGSGHVYSGALGFLSCFALVCIAVIIWLVIDRMRKQKEIHRLMMLSVAITSESTERLANAQGGSCSDFGSESKCPAMAIIPTLARFHSRQLSCGNEDSILGTAAKNACRRVRTSHMNNRSHSADVLTSVISHDTMGDYAVIRNNDVKDSLNSRNRWSQPISSATPREFGCSKYREPEASVSGNGEPDPSTTSENKLEIINEALRESLVSSEDTTNDLCRSKPQDEHEDDAHRYSLVRKKRLEHSPTSKRGSGRSSTMSTDFSSDLLIEISNATDIRFDKDTPSHGKRGSQGNAHNQSRGSSGAGVYEDIEIPSRLPVSQPSNNPHMSVTSDDLTDVSDLSETSSEDSDQEDLKQSAHGSATMVLPEVVVTPADGDTASELSAVSPSIIDREVTGDWLAFENEDALLL